jgi:nucleotide-binding universal stress UspA family protein
MTWGHVLAAADGSPAGLHALAVAGDLCQAAQLRLSVVTVLPVGPEDAVQLDPAIAALRPIVAHGIPGIEIVRVSEEVGADLLVLGRKLYDFDAGPRLGATADQVARRSRIPCLFVPEQQQRFAHHLVALDGTERGFAVFEAAREFLQLAGGDVEVVTVEPQEASVGTGAHEVPRARTLRVAGTLDRMARENGLRHYPFQVLRGEPVRLLQGELKHPASDLLVVGSRRGGPSGPPPESSGTGRVLLYSVSCAVLTVPI